MNSPNPPPLDDDHLAAWLSDERMACTRSGPAAPAVPVAVPASVPPPAPPPPDPLADIWPAGPPPLRPSDLARLVAAILADPQLVDAAQLDQQGLTLRRVLRLRAIPLTGTAAEACVRTFLVWLDHAGLLAPPPFPDFPWQEPRRLAVADVDAIAAALRATTLPTPDAVQAAFVRRSP